jgi:hypothetical protein
MMIPEGSKLVSWMVCCETVLGSLLCDTSQTYGTLRKYTEYHKNAWLFTSTIKKLPYKVVDCALSVTATPNPSARESTIYFVED